MLEPAMHNALSTCVGPYRPHDYGRYLLATVSKALLKSRMATSVCLPRVLGRGKKASRAVVS